MALIRHYKPSVRLEYEELDGLINVINQQLESGDLSTDVEIAFIGCLATLEIIRNHEYVEYPHQFVELLKHYLAE